MFLIGGGGHAKVIADIALRLGLDIQGFYDDNPSRKIFDIPFMGNIGQINSTIKGDQFLVSIGSNLIRKNICSIIQGSFSDALIHPEASISQRGVSIGEGSVVMNGVVINVETQIGKHVIINTSSSIDHECIIGDFSHISPNATLCGDVHVGEGTHFGAGAIAIPGVRIGKWCTIGAGSVILKDVPDYSTVVGNPGRVIKTSNG